MLEKAQNIDDIMEVFNSKLPFDPIEEGKAKRAWELFYTDSIDVHNDIKKIKLKLIKKSEKKIFLTGAKGNGKTVKLKKIAIDEKINDKFDVIYFSVFEELDLNDLNFMEVLFLMISKVSEVANKNSVKIDNYTKKEIKKLYDFIIEKAETINLQTIGFESVAELQASAETKFDIPFFTKLSTAFKGVLKNQSIERKEIRKRFTPDISKMIDTFNHMYNEIKNKTNRDILIIIDDIEKVNNEDYNRLFSEHSMNFSNMSAYMLITYPLTLKENANIKSIGSRHNLSTLKIFSSDNEVDSDSIKNREALKKLILQRIDENVNLNEIFEDGVIEYLIEQSGGVISLLINLVGDSAMEAELNDSTAISKRDVDKALDNERVNMTRLLTSKSYELFRSINDKKEVPENEEEEVLNNFISTWHIIEYSNGKSWYRVNPIISSIL